MFLAGCFSSLGPVTADEQPIPDTTANPGQDAVTFATNTPRPTESPYPWTDENAVHGGICFEAALDAAERLFVIRNAEDHIRFYGLADNSGLCRGPVTRNPFDFAGERVLAGMWSVGSGCTARHDVIGWEQNNAEQTFTIQLRFVTEGDCPYELVRPFWVGLDGVGDDEIIIEMVE